MVYLQKEKCNLHHHFHHHLEQSNTLRTMLELWVHIRHTQPNQLANRITQHTSKPQKFRKSKTYQFEMFGQRKEPKSVDGIRVGKRRERNLQTKKENAFLIMRNRKLENTKFV